MEHTPMIDATRTTALLAKLKMPPSVPVAVGRGHRTEVQTVAKRVRDGLLPFLRKRMPEDQIVQAIKELEDATQASANASKGSGTLNKLLAMISGYQLSFGLGTLLSTTINPYMNLVAGPAAVLSSPLSAAVLQTGANYNSPADARINAYVDAFVANVEARLSRSQAEIDTTQSALNTATDKLIAGRGIGTAQAFATDYMRLMLTDRLPINTFTLIYYVVQPLNARFVFPNQWLISRGLNVAAATTVQMIAGNFSSLTSMFFQHYARRRWQEDSVNPRAYDFRSLEAGLAADEKVLAILKNIIARLEKKAAPRIVAVSSSSSSSSGEEVHGDAIIQLGQDALDPESLDDDSDEAIEVLKNLESDPDASSLLYLKRMAANVETGIVALKETKTFRDNLQANYQKLWSNKRKLTANLLATTMALVGTTMILSLIADHVGESDEYEFRQQMSYLTPAYIVLLGGWTTLPFGIHLMQLLLALFLGFIRGAASKTAEVLGIKDPEVVHV